jgi:hypothetical protein
MCTVSPLGSDIFIFTAVCLEIYAKNACLVSIPAMIRAVKYTFYVLILIPCIIEYVGTDQQMH